MKARLSDTAALIVMSLCSAALGVLLTAAAAAETPAERYLSSVTPAPSYGPDVVAAGYHVCGALGRGASVEDVVRQAKVDGIGGDLYPTGAVLDVVQNAQRYLCP